MSENLKIIQLDERNEKNIEKCSIIKNTCSMINDFTLGLFFSQKF